MKSQSNMDTIFVAAAAALLTILVLLASRGRNTNLPPGPPKDPLIGHLLKIPPGNQAEIFHQWSQIYGDIMYLKVFGREMVILGSLKASQELLEHRGTNYCCRPKITMFEIMGWYPTLTFLQYGKRFLKHRKIFQQYFSPRESRKFDHVFAEEARILAKSLPHAVEGRHFDLVYRFTTSNIMRAAFGHRVRSDDDPFLKLGVGVSHALNNSGPVGSTPVDFFPWLRYLPSWFPGGFYTGVARSSFPVIRELHEAPVKFVQERTQNGGNIERSFISDMLEELGDHVDNEELDDIKGGSATIFAGGLLSVHLCLGVLQGLIRHSLTSGTDTTNATLTIFFLAMIRHPEVQKRAYQEIVSVVGPDRLPVYSDKESLPYLECVLNETLRWHPAVQLGVPHRALEEDVYDGMFIPKGAVMIANVHGMSRDENIYSEPWKFDPTRYLPQPHGKGEPVFTAVWGFGRRICPGQHFAPIALWHAMACILATLEIKPVEDEHGNPLLPDVAFTEGLISKALPFDLRVEIRSEAAKAILAEIEV
ncbi:hypothetical protein VNI00_009304 [Paramarasmius palmivorus]|uniref:Cytochrome P450 n=1 Tax=Paramarasmius palmivorus TaxID=297713 RepID=A0AAW0CUD0_9AGAR